MRALAAIVFLLATPPANSTSCVHLEGEDGSVPVLPVAGHDLVFEGIALDARQIWGENGNARWLDRVDTTFKVKKLWYGQVDGEEVVMTTRYMPIRYDKQYPVGSRYVVLAVKIDDIYVSTVCSPPRWPELEAALLLRIADEYGNDD